MSVPAVNTPAIPPSLMFRERPRISRCPIPRMVAVNSVSISYLEYRRLVVGPSDWQLRYIGPRVFFYRVVLCSLLFAKVF